MVVVLEVAFGVVVGVVDVVVVVTVGMSGAGLNAKSSHAPSRNQFNVFPLVAQV